MRPGTGDAFYLVNLEDHASWSVLRMLTDVPSASACLTTIIG